MLWTGCLSACSVGQRPFSSSTMCDAAGEGDQATKQSIMTINREGSLLPRCQDQVDVNDKETATLLCLMVGLALPDLVFLPCSEQYSPLQSG